MSAWTCHESCSFDLEVFNLYMMEACPFLRSSDDQIFRNSCIVFVSSADPPSARFKLAFLFATLRVLMLSATSRKVFFES